MLNAILLMGPTASGKTELALQLAQVLPVEIISVDSALIYQDMNIGTAKPSAHELQTVPHHLIDIKSPLDSYSVADFLSASCKIARDIIKQKKIPLFVGGTMMYYNALINGISNLPQSSPDIRKKLEAELLELGLPPLYEKLIHVDPVGASKINPTDPQRILRALEVYTLSGIAMSQLQQISVPQVAHDFNFLGVRIIPQERSLLHDRINQRFMLMLEQGFIDEVKYLRQKYAALRIEHTSMRCVGYKQVWQYLDGVIDYSELTQYGQAATRQLAKRQLTWLRNMDYSRIAALIDLDLGQDFKQTLLSVHKHFANF